MKPNVATLLLMLPLTAGLKANEVPPSHHESGVTAETEAPTAASILATQVRDIASSSTLSRKSQAKLITNAVRLAITTAIENIKDPEARLKIALELTTAATEAAPRFAATITDAVTGIPAIAGIEGAVDGVKDAVKKGQEPGEEPDMANPSRNPRRPEHEFGGSDKSEHIVSPSR